MGGLAEQVDGPDRRDRAPEGEESQVLTSGSAEQLPLQPMNIKTLQFHS